MAMYGKDNPFYGHKHTEEAKEKNRLAHIGKKPTVQTRKKLREANAGQNNGFYGKHHSEETRHKLSEIAKQREASQETCLAISKGHLGEKNSFYGKHHTEEALSKNRKAHLGKVAPLEVREKMSRRHKLIWSQSEEYKNKRMSKIIQANKKSPNTKELAILAMLEEIQPNVWQFVGDGGIIEPICGKMPDFWNGDHKLIEHFGVWWHRNHNPQDRIDLFATKGFKTLIIQEMELIKRPDKVKEKIREFVNK